MSEYLLDTNAFSHAIRRTFLELNRRLDLIESTRVAISVITEAELLFGLARRPHATTLSASVHELLAKVSILPWTSAATGYYAVIRSELEQRGTRMDDLDMMIAAHALAEDAVLVTNDAAFRRIDRLRVEDWTLP